MPLLALTRGNLDFVKHGLRAHYPSIKSSHLSEALAAACGFRANISMVASLKEMDRERPNLIDIDNNRFSARLGVLGHQLADHRSLSHLVRSEALPERNWVFNKGKDALPLNRWYWECQRRDVPYIHVTPRRKYARVNWDCISLDKKHDDVIRKNDGREFVQHMFRTFQAIAKVGAKKAKFDGSAFVGEIEDVPISIAPTMADAIYRVLYEAIQRRQ